VVFSAWREDTQISTRELGYILMDVAQTAPGFEGSPQLTGLILFFSRAAIVLAGAFPSKLTPSIASTWTGIAFPLPLSINCRSYALLPEVLVILHASPLPCVTGMVGNTWPLIVKIHLPPA